MITFITSIPAYFILYAPVLEETDYVLGSESDTQVQFGAFEAGSSLQALFTFPEFVWELFLGIYATFKGFKPSPITSGETGRWGWPEPSRLSREVRLHSH